MDIEHIREMVAGLTIYTTDLLVTKLRAELSKVIVQINADIGEDIDALMPQCDKIFNAFRICPVERTRVVLIGQDPYPRDATGMSFSVPPGAPIPPSLRNIIKCLRAQELIKNKPASGDLTAWARQGVLLLNTALTTRAGESNVHADIWAAYTDKIVAALSAEPRDIIFILLGKAAQAKTNFIDGTRHMVLKWGHPSPLCYANQQPCPGNFINCTVFNQTNEILLLRGSQPIDWELSAVPLAVAAPAQLPPHPDPQTLYLFTDGAARGNGRKYCVSSWAWRAYEGKKVKYASGIVPPIKIDGEIYCSSNNRGELMAIQYGFDYVISRARAEDKPARVLVISDSAYSIKALTLWAAEWVKNIIKRQNKKNLDIIIPTKQVLDEIRTMVPLEFMHVNSHRPRPSREASPLELFIWIGNDTVDKMATAITAAVPVKGDD